LLLSLIASSANSTLGESWTWGRAQVDRSGLGVSNCIPAVPSILPLAIPGLISAFIFCFTLCWNEFIYALTFLQSTSNKTVPVAIVNEFVDGDIYRWGSLMAGALAGSLPLVILYAFFVEHYVSAMTGAVKE